jgi:F-type H+-transporting ATPase subunit epsilon
VSLSLEILMPDKTLLRAEPVEVRAVDATGSFALLPLHEDFCTALVPSILTYAEPDGSEHYVALDGGALVLEDGRVSVVTRDGVASDDIDRASARVADMLRLRQVQEQEAATTLRKLVAELLQRLSQLETRR